MWQSIVNHHVRTVIILSIVLNAVIILLSGMPGYQGELPNWITYLPMMNAIFNSFTFVFLLGALFSILNGHVQLHQRFIYAAFTTTSFFLVSYVIFHFMAESTSYGGSGFMAAVYYFVLITHIVLAAVIVPLALMSFFTGYKRIASVHKKWVRWTMPLWLYVSFTGVLVYLMISPYYSF
ncbi:DUF420 domain-containing protein [Salisediminibacterium selenitireducens]|uniref:DUF420 domain-containing protein n=1 Tax=Bacillus selenitireducens (strain ATCC 700615 / DSM 15326 / MLS10) TaxID=439292 RepID=D6XUS6_BACIE|nr:DUF420 domain-containing protein [Salisediminibacterium selenitireducens]ADH99562.1 protein of unknown function DUF420 [[Bacillus] selenitireducens MLS10]